MTLDTDVAIPRELPPKQRSVRESLLANGFDEEFLGTDRPPATHYRLSGGKTGFYAEFLTPLVGSRHKRGGERAVAVEVCGVNSQALRYIDLLMLKPWTVRRGGSRIRIANPASFLAQKILIHSRRSHEDQAKDVLYLHDTLEVFSQRLGDLREDWESVVSARLTSKQVGRMHRAAEAMFGDTTDAIRRASRYAVGRSVSAVGIRDLCRLGLRQVFSRHP